MNDNPMVYVAADPDQPGAAYAITVDMPQYAKDTAKTIAKWVKGGAHILRVTKDEGLVMLSKWKRPAKKQGELYGCK